jgi:hypothetical protein
MLPQDLKHPTMQKGSVNQTDQENITKLNCRIYVEIFSKDTGTKILSITNSTTKCAVIVGIVDEDATMIVHALQKNWFQTFGPPD